MRLHDFHSRVKESGKECPAFALEIIQGLYPKVQRVFSVEEDKALQKKGIDYILYDNEDINIANVVATIDKKERGTWNRFGKNQKVFDDIALEIVTVANPDLSPLDLKSRADYWKGVFVEKLRMNRDIEEVFGILKKLAPKGETVNPGWATKDKTQRTVDATLYVIGPLGKGYLIDETKMQEVLVKELPKLVKQHNVISMRGTLSRDSDSGRIWGVSNYGVGVEVLRRFMEIPEIAFEPYDINLAKNKKDTDLGNKKTGTTDLSRD